MAVYTKVSEEELATFLLDYDIGLAVSFSGITEGVENSNFRLTTDKGHYILTLYEKRVETSDLPFFIGLMSHLSTAGIDCPVPIADRSGEVLKQLNGRHAAIVSFMQGTSSNRPHAERCFAGGKALAQIHQAARDFKMIRSNALNHEAWIKLLDTVEADEKLIAEAQERLENILGQWPRNLPYGTIHADLFPDNVLFIGDNVTGLIDFYFACQDILSYDLAIMLNAWCFETDLSFNITKAKRLLAGYQSVRPLSAEEVDAIPVLCRGAAMRFFLTRLYDSINTPLEAQVRPHDPMEYWRRLNFHFQVEKPSAYGI